jgi:hypothetical protein
MLSTDKTIENLRFVADSDNFAVFNDTSTATLGRLELRRIRTIGCVRLIASDNCQSTFWTLMLQLRRTAGNQS